MSELPRERMQEKKNWLEINKFILEKEVLEAY